MSHSESEPYFDTESDSYKCNEDFIHFLVQEHSASNTTSLDIMDLDILPPKLGELIRAYARRTFTMPPSHIVPVPTS